MSTNPLVNCLCCRPLHPRASKQQRILLSNGRFPVTIDLARQLHKAGHIVYVVDPMEFHVCKFSNAVRKSYEVPSPREDAGGYIAAVKHAVEVAKIDLIIPLHEEILYLASCNEPEILSRLFAPPMTTLLELHNKWSFTQLLSQLSLGAPEARLCKSYEDVRKLPRDREIALKPVYGRASSNVYHLKPSEPLPENIDIKLENPYIAQDWLYGNRFCSYAVARKGRVVAFAVYPVVETIDGSSCVWFQSIRHSGILEFTTHIASALNITGQLAFDFIENEDGLHAIECNPRATSGVHLYSGSPNLALAMTEPLTPEDPVLAKPGAKRQIGPGMLMVPKGHKRTWHEYFAHMKRLVTSRDVVFKMKDLGPTLMEPFLLTSYWEICREKKLSLPEMFQWDLVWEPDADLGKKVDINDLEHRREVEGRDSGVGESESSSNATGSRFRDTSRVST